MKKLLYVLICAAVLTSCKKDTEVEPAINIDNIYTKWKLNMYDGGLAYTKYYPTDITIEFNKAGNFKRYRNGTILEDYSYTIKHETPPKQTEGLYFIVSTGMITQYITTAKRDTLVIADYAADGYTYHYTRIK